MIIFLPKDSLLGDLDKGWGILEKVLQHSRLWIAAQSTGVAVHALDEAEKYTSNREQFGKKLQEIPEVANHVAVLKRQVEIAKVLVRKAAWQEVCGDGEAFVWSSLAKLIASETALWAAGESMLLHGGIGYTNEMPISQILADAAVLRIYEGTSHIQLKIIERRWSRKQFLPLFPPTAALALDLKTLPSIGKLMRNLEDNRRDKT